MPRNGWSCLGIVLAAALLCGPAVGFAAATDASQLLGQSTRPVTNTNTLMRDMTYVETHDAAMGFWGSNSDIEIISIKTRFLKTQDTNFYGQLWCGARALDMRIRWDEGSRKTHFIHGNYQVEQGLESEIGYLFDWGQQHKDELVIIYMAECKDQPSDLGCMDTVYQNILQRYNLYVMAAENLPGAHATTADLPTLTVAEATRRANEASGTGLFVLASGRSKDVVQENWDDSVRYGGDCEKSIAVFERYAFSKEGIQFAGVMPRNQTTPNTIMWQLQAFFQYDPSKDGGGHRSGSAESLQPTCANQKNIEYVNSGRYGNGEWPGQVNLLEINWICQGGRQLAEAVIAKGLSTAVISDDDKAHCLRACNQDGQPQHYVGPLTNVPPVGLVVARNHGDYARCPPGTAVTQACGSGRDEDCYDANGKNVYGWIICNAKVPTSAGNSYEKGTVGYGQVCDNGDVITGICFSGRDKDCKPTTTDGPNQRSLIMCQPLGQPGVGGCDRGWDVCPLVKGDYELDRCPAGEILQGWCNGGRDTDCQCATTGGKTHSSGCCARGFET